MKSEIDKTKKLKELFKCKICGGKLSPGQEAGIFLQIIKVIKMRIASRQRECPVCLCPKTHSRSGGWAYDGEYRCPRCSFCWLPGDHRIQEGSERLVISRSEIEKFVT